MRRIIIQKDQAQMYARKQEQSSLPARRSTRKSKKIRHDDQFRLSRSRLALQPPNFHPDFISTLSPALESHCRRLIETDRRVHRGQLLTEMGGAITLQCQKLQSFFQIKIELVPFVPPQQPEAQAMLGLIEMRGGRRGSLLEQVMQEFSEGRQELLGRGEKGVSWGEAVSVDFWSSPQSLGEEPVLRKHESARLLCDNYQKRDLIYSFQTLIPRLAREDIEPLAHHFN